MHVIENQQIDQKIKKGSRTHTKKDYVFRDYKKEVRERLKKLAEEKFPLIENVELVIQHGNPYKEILKFVIENKIGLIVVATHGRTGFAHVVIGSVAEKIVRYSPVPVLTVKPEELGDKFLTREDVEKELHLKFKPDELNLF